jgi:hypothetical protein
MDLADVMAVLAEVKSLEDPAERRQVFQMKMFELERQQANKELRDRLHREHLDPPKRSRRR